MHFHEKQQVTKAANTQTLNLVVGPKGGVILCDLSKVETKLLVFDRRNDVNVLLNAKAIVLLATRYLTL